MVAVRQRWALFVASLAVAICSHRVIAFGSCPRHDQPSAAAATTTFDRRTTPSSLGETTRSSDSGNVARLSEEESLRRAVVDVLLPVFFPEDDTSQLSSEMSLRRALKKRQDDWSGFGRRLSSMVLGVSVMRLRHWYTASVRDRISYPLPHPLEASLKASLPLSFDDKAGSGPAKTEVQLILAMIDEHASYLGGATSMFPAVDKAVSLSLQYSLPTFITKPMLEQYGGNQTRRIFSVMNRPGPITLRRNAMRFAFSDQDLCDCLEDDIEARPLSTMLENKEKLEPVPEHGQPDAPRVTIGRSKGFGPPDGAIHVSRLSKSIWSSKAWRQGFFEVQDAGSQLIVQSLELRSKTSHQRILDFCAGNGGKTFAMASMACNSHIDVVAHDIVEERLRQIKGSLPRVGFKAEDENARFNETIYVSEKSNCTIQIKTSLNRTCSFDAVLVDAPCSSIGVLRRRPSQRWELTAKSIDDLVELQLEILINASSLVKPGGNLVYSTCSLLRSENEDVARRFEDSKLSDNFTRWNFGDKLGGLQHAVTILPTENGSDGFFIARWKRRQPV